MSAGADPDPTYTPVIDERAAMQRTPRQVAREAAMLEVSETLLNIEQAVRRADRAHRTVAAAPTRATSHLPCVMLSPRCKPPTRRCSRRPTSATISSG